MADNPATFVCRVSRNSENLNFLEPSGSLMACTGFPLPTFLQPFQANARLLLKLDHDGFLTYFSDSSFANYFITLRHDVA